MELVVAVGVEGELAKELAGVGVDNAYVEVFDEEITGVPDWVRPIPMWWSLEAWRRVTQPVRRCGRGGSGCGCRCRMVGVRFGEPLVSVGGCGVVEGAVVLIKWAERSRSGSYLRIRRSIARYSPSNMTAVVAMI